ncbi:MAG: hypothetical protein AAF846_08835 [Chloroflexota bacterium]
MRHFIVLLSLLWIVSVSSSAQNTVAYQLRQPTIDDYLLLMNDHFMRNDTDYYGIGLTETILQTLNIRDLPLETASPDVLRASYNLISEDFPLRIDQTHWQNILLSHAIGSDHFNPINGHSTLSDYTIEATPIDFDNNGNTEYLLDVSYTPLLYRAYHIAYQEESGDWVVTDTPLGAYLEGIAGWVFEQWETILFEDITNDSSIEWVVNTYAQNTGIGAATRSYIRVLSWREDEMVNIAPDNFGYNNTYRENIQWEIDDNHTDGVMEFARIHTHINNWGCSYDTVHPLMWNADTGYYEDDEVVTLRPDTFGCLQEQAELAMWDANYISAIRLYERAFERDLPTSYTADSLIQYGRIRLALAYALSGDLDNAQSWIDAITTTENTNESLHDLIERVRAINLNTSGGFGLCETLYSYFLHENYWIGKYVGVTLTDGELSALNPSSRPDPNLSGCNLSQLVLDLLSEDPFNIASSPLTRFQEANIRVIEQSQADFNGDNIDDWIIITDLPLNPLLFLSDINVQNYIV